MDDLESIQYFLQVNGDQHLLSGRTFGSVRTEFSTDYRVENTYYAAGDQVKAIIVVNTKSGETAIFESLPLQILN